MSNAPLQPVSEETRQSIQAVYETLRLIFDMPVPESIPVQHGDLRINRNDQVMEAIDGFLVSTGDRGTIAIRATLSASDKIRVEAFLVAQYEAYGKAPYGLLINVGDIPNA